MSRTGPYSITFSRDAQRHLGVMTARQRRIVVDTVEEQLRHEPTVPIRQRKILRENPIKVFGLELPEESR